MSIFNFFKFTSPQTTQAKPEGKSPVSLSLLKSNSYRQFEKTYIDSFSLKDQASLASALRMRQNATESVQDSPALYCLGKHHEMILEYNHLGHGVEARKSALESLKHEEDFKGISQLVCSNLACDYYAESLQYMSVFSGSYEESLHYLARLQEQFPSDANRLGYEEIKKLQAQSSRWYIAHRAILSTFYSRVSAEQDKGSYAAGLSIIDVILSNTQKSGYMLDYEEYVDLLDDMCVLSIKLLMQKNQCRPKVRSMDDDANELGPILLKPIAYLSDFIPDCLPKDRPMFENYYQVFSSISWINNVPGWKDLKFAMGNESDFDSFVHNDEATGSILNMQLSGGPPFDSMAAIKKPITYNHDAFRWKFFIVMIFCIVGACIGLFLSKFLTISMLPVRLMIGMSLLPMLYFRMRKSFRSGVCFVCKRFVQTEMERKKSSQQHPLFAGSREMTGAICMNCGRVACHMCSDVPCKCGFENKRTIGVSVSI